MNYLIVNAYDFGFSGDSNDGIIEVYLGGSVNSASLLIQRHMLLRLCGFGEKVPGALRRSPSCPGPSSRQEREGE